MADDGDDLDNIHIPEDHDASAGGGTYKHKHKSIVDDGLINNDNASKNNNEQDDIEQVSVDTAPFIIKEFVTEKSSEVKRLSRIEFSVLSPQDVRQLSSVEIVHKQFYVPNTIIPQKNSVLDTRLGAPQKRLPCETCGKGLQDCVGHFGHVSLNVPVFHIGFVRHIQALLSVICKTCSRVLLEPEVVETCVRQMSRITDLLRKKAFFKGIVTKCKKTKRCFYCNAINGQVKKVKAAMRLVHVPYEETRSGQFDREKYFSQFAEAAKRNTEMTSFISAALQDLTPQVVYKLFLSIRECDYPLLNLGNTKPQDMIMTKIPVSPVCIRPSVPVGGGTGGTNEDDLTVKMADIVYINNFMKGMVDSGAAPMNYVENSEFLQQQIAMYINSDLPGFPKSLNLKKIRALVQRLKGKQGRFRGNLSGKRVDFSGRTVISPDPNLAIDQVGIPLWTAKRMTFPERVTTFNLSIMRKVVENGPDVHPGANFVERKGNKRSLKFVDRNLVAKNLRPGDIVERHMWDGDVVLFNRQPSLHRLSIMCHRAKILPWRTHRFNVSVCEPYNADFDGDEMNLHLPQTHEARAEAAELMAVHKNLVTPRHGAPLVGPNQDFLTACYLITSKDVFYDRAQFCHLCCYFNDGAEQVIPPPPAILKPVQLWTGKQIFSVLLKPNNDATWPLLNCEVKEKWYEKDGPMDPKDGYVMIRNSMLLCGGLGKVVLKGSKAGVVYTLIRYHDPVASARVMSRIAKLCGRWLANRGFSIGIDDVTPSEKLVCQKKELLDGGYARCDDYLKQFENGKLQLQPGCNEEQTLEAKMSGALSELRDKAGSACVRELPRLYNSPLIMTLCGSKGSPLNISQMVALVGQQIVNGVRIPNGFVNRTLPHFERFSRTPAAKGFVQNSFFSGLTGTEFFFHTMGGREGLVDTAVKTAETGYMQRRLVKALEDLCCVYDGSVRSSENVIVQFQYGDDGLDPIMLEGKGPIDLTRLFNYILLWNQSDEILNEPVLNSSDILLSSQQYVDEYGEDLPQHYKAEVLESVRNSVKKLEEVEVDVLMDSSLPLHLKENLLHSILRVRDSQLRIFFHECRRQYFKARMEPGTAVGAIAAQSIGEPGTQMTLKTFHFAGVASMNVTLGVPRIKEIINATSNIKTPIIKLTLDNSHDEQVARIVKGRIEKTTLGDVAEYIKEVYSRSQAYVIVKLDLDTIDRLQLEVTIDTVKARILAHRPLKLASNSIHIESASVLRIYSPDASRERMMFRLRALKIELPNIPICGIEGITRTVINDDGKGNYELIVEGNNLLQVMGTPGIVAKYSKSNHVLEVQDTLGIEAARATIIKEIQETMESHGLTVDIRHIQLLADVMSYRGQILGITRFGISKMRSSVLMLASFERTENFLFEAAAYGSNDDILGVSECIIMGVPMEVGTGLFKLIHDVDLPKVTTRRPSVIKAYHPG